MTSSVCLFFRKFHQNSSDSAGGAPTDWRSQFGFYINGVLTAVLASFGCLLNALCVYLFILPLRKHRSPIIYYYLIALELWDSGVLINAFLMYALPTILYGRLVASGPYVLLYPYVYTLSNISLIGTVWVILTLTVDRYLALVHPLRHRALRRTQRVNRILIAVSTAAFCYGIPRFFELNVVLCQNDTLPVIIQGSLVNTRMYMLLYRVIGGILLYSLGPFVVLLCLTVRISLEVKKASRRRSSMCGTRSIRTTNYGQATERSSQLMLLAVIIKFLCAHTMPTGLDLAEHAIGSARFRREPLASLLVDISNLLVVLNSSTNFLTYFLCGASFRLGFREILKKNKSDRISRSTVRFSSQSRLDTLRRVQMEVEMNGIRRKRNYTVGEADSMPRPKIKSAKRRGSAIRGSQEAQSAGEISYGTFECLV